MSTVEVKSPKIIASAAIRGAHAIVKKAEERVAAVIKEKGKPCPIELSNTGYFLPVIYSMLGVQVKTASDFEEVLNECRQLLPDPVADELWLPYLGPTLDAGMATLFAEEIIEACNYTIGPNPVEGIWLGAADDVILRERGIQFVDGTAPGFAAIAGAAPDVETAVKMIRELQKRSIYVFMAGHSRGTTLAEQLTEAGVQLGWDTRLIPFGREIHSAVFALGFAARAALSFGGVQPGDFKRNLLYNKLRVFAFVIALGEVTDEWYATAAGAINFGFPTIADTDIPQILPTGVCTYEHVVSNVPHDEIVQRAIEVRGLKIKISEVPVPVPYGPAFEGERVRKEDMHCEMGGRKSEAFEYLTTRPLDEVEDGKIEVIGPEIDEVDQGEALPMGVWVEVAGRKMQPDFEPVLERQIHRFFNEAHGIFHMGQRHAIWVRYSKEGAQAGLKFHHIGDILHAKFHDEYSTILDKVQVKIFTTKADVDKYMAPAKQVFAERDARLADLTDEKVETFYSCTLCQSFAPNHVCVITPERSGLCGAYSWLDGRAAYEITPSGPNQPLEKGVVVDEKLGQWEGINKWVYEGTNQTLERFSAYSMVTDPMTSCGCFECITAILPSTNGIMIVDRDHADMTPCGMKFSTLAGTVGGGNQVPGFIGHSKQYITSKKFISADGGMVRIVWMPKALKEQLAEVLEVRAKEQGVENFLEMVADETVGTTEEEVLAHLQKTQHPALSMDPMF